MFSSNIHNTYIHLGAKLKLPLRELSVIGVRMLSLILLIKLLKLKENDRNENNFLSFAPKAQNDPFN